MMKRILTFTIALLATLTIWAGGDKAEVPMVVQITEAERSTMPDKTIEMELRQMKFGKKADAAFVEQLTNLMHTLADEDGSNYVYVVLLSPQGESIQVSIQAEDILRDGGNAKSYYGTMTLGRKHFVFRRTADNETQLKSLLEKDKGKLNYVREYEIVEFKVERQEAMLTAHWHNGQMDVTTIVANGENLLMTQ